MIKKLAICLVALTFMLSTFNVKVEAATIPLVFVDGERLAFSTNPIIKNGSTLVPMRLIFEKLGATVNWNNSSKTVTATKSGVTIVYTIGKSTANVNGKSFTLNQAGEIKDSNTLVPLRFVSESLGSMVGWADKSKTVIISSAVMKKATVTKVVDGDTIDVKFEDGTVERVRLIGVDTPESVHPDADRNSQEGMVTSDYTKAELLNKTVMLEFDVGERDQYGRILAYVYVNSLMYNVKLAMEGYAQQMTYQPNVRWESLFKYQVQDARAHDRGLWAFDGEDGKALSGTTGKLVIEKVDYHGEVVTIVNKDNQAINMTGWTLVSVKGNQTFTFPDGFTLAKGAKVYITSGANAKQTGQYLKWTTANVHNNDGNDPAQLFDMNGTLISTFGK